MGVKNLWDILESCKKTLPFHHLQNKRLCIDLSCWMVQLQSVNRSHCAMKDKLYLKGLFHRLRALIALNCRLIFVTDGSIPALKVGTYRRRLNPLNEVARDDAEANKPSSLKRNKGSEFSCIIKEAKLLGMALGIPCLDGLEEAEAQCALLNSESLCDGCFSADSDILLFGAQTVYRDICLGDGGYVVCYEMADIEQKLGFRRNSLIAFALLLGSDYSRGVHGFGPELALQAIQAIENDDLLQRLALEGVSFLKRSKTVKKPGHKLKNQNKENCSDYGDEMNVLPPGSDSHSHKDEFLQVIDAYYKPKCHSADSNAVIRALAIYPFQRTKLQQICTQLFEWPPEKTDEYMLPKIAERDLRKFANLRASCSELGGQLPLDKVPIKCPISEVIKQRKVQGKECYEVSWEELVELKTSIVPGDLLKSACPEKIVEFEDRKAEKKQNGRKSRPKKRGDKALSIEIDANLHNLLLEFESGKSRKEPSSSCSEGVSSTVTDVMTCNIPLQVESESNMISSSQSTITANNSAIVTLDSLLQQEIESNMDFTPTKSWGPNQVTAMEKDVIDLLSPSPDQNPRNYSRCQGGTFDSLLQQESESNMDTTPIKSCGDHAIAMEKDTIDLSTPSPEQNLRNVSRCSVDSEQNDVNYMSDSDMEISPDHARKARELRSFLDLIREEIS